MTGTFSSESNNPTAVFKPLDQALDSIECMLSTVEITDGFTKVICGNHPTKGYLVIVMPAAGNSLEIGTVSA